MNRSLIDLAVASGQPFKIRMADGCAYEVATRGHSFISPKGTFVILADGVAPDNQVINGVRLE